MRLKAIIDLFLVIPFSVGLIIVLTINFFSIRLKSSNPSKHNVMLVLSREGKRKTHDRGFDHLLPFDNPELNFVIFLNLFAEKNISHMINDRLLYVTASSKRAIEFKSKGFKATSFILSLIFSISILISYKEIFDFKIVRSMEPHIMGSIATIIKLLFRDVFFIQDIRANFNLLHSNNNSLVKNSYQFIRQLTYKRADLVFGLSQDNAMQAIREGALRVRFLRINIAPDHFYISDRVNLKRYLGIEDYNVILFCGRLEFDKRPLDAIMAFKEVRNMRQDVKLVIAGSGSLQTSLRETAYVLGLTDHIIFLGEKPNGYIRNLLSTADLILIPLGGSILVEAALSETPIIAYDWEGHGELITDGETGFLTPAKNHRLMGSKAIELLDNPELTNMIGWKARNKAYYMFNIESIRDTESNYYRELLVKK